MVEAVRSDLSWANEGICKVFWKDGKLKDIAEAYPIAARTGVTVVSVRILVLLGEDLGFKKLDLRECEPFYTKLTSRVLSCLDNNLAYN